MKRIACLTAVAVALTSSSALAQIREIPQPQPIDQPAAWTQMPTRSAQECLRNKRTGKLECRTRAQWREVAARIEAGKPYPRP